MDEVRQAFKAFKRVDFLRAAQADLADMDMPIPIGFGATNSQPTTVRMMLEWLEVKPGDKILDVGSGSGWTTALLSKLTGPKGCVYAVEIVPELLEWGQENVKKAGVKNAEFHLAGQKLGLPGNAPFNRILVSASPRKLPAQLIYQLVPGGKMVIPVANAILEIDKSQGKAYDIFVHHGFAFVPLINSTSKRG